MGHLGWQPFPLLGCLRVRISLRHHIPLVPGTLQPPLPTLQRSFPPFLAVARVRACWRSRGCGAGMLAWMLSATWDKCGPLTGKQANALLLQPWSHSCGMQHFGVTPLAPAAGTCLISAFRAETQGNGRSGSFWVLQSGSWQRRRSGGTSLPS